MRLYCNASIDQFINLFSLSPHMFNGRVAQWQSVCLRSRRFQVRPLARSDFFVVRIADGFFAHRKLHWIFAFFCSAKLATHPIKTAELNHQSTCHCPPVINSPLSLNGRSAIFYLYTMTTSNSETLVILMLHILQLSC